MLPKVSVIIINFNGREYLERCLDSVFKNTYPNFEVIVVDNGSTDGSTEYIRNIFGKNERLKIIQNKKNFGPAYARNVGIKEAKAKYIAFLDNDTKADPNWLFEPIHLMEEDFSIGACQCKILLMDQCHKFDYVGDYISQYGFLVQRANALEPDNGQYDSYDEILSAKSAAMVVRRDLLEEIKGFDSDYFIYLEETDLAIRVWLEGYRIVFTPNSRVYHAFGITLRILPHLQNYLAKFHGTKNYITTLLKNFEIKTLFKMLPIHICLWLGIAFWFILKLQFKDAFYVIKGIAWVFINLASILKKRRLIQIRRVVDDREIFPKVMRKKPLSYFYKKLTSVHTIGYAQSWYRPKR